MENVDKLSQGVGGRRQRAVCACKWVVIDGHHMRCEVLERGCWVESCCLKLLVEGV